MLSCRKLRAAKIGHPLTYKGVRLYSDAHESETYEEFTDRYVKFFEGVDDRFELSRGLNNCFAHDKVPSPSVIEASLRAARRVNDFSTAVRIFEGLKQKVENDVRSLKKYIYPYLYFEYRSRLYPTILRQFRAVSKA
ncbi:COX5A-domain-containing protein [Rhizophagus clarus]|uniref:Cytochrome c oxidase subunit 6, mitochondrial n=1 Tax=Rhizophagus clarus TaxID=94130 RepID=A0A8H3KRX9_9GLOM|nr:COX5A-domain-containing protein [Rhizophagus clarus]